MKKKIKPSKDYQDGFKRACLLIVGDGVKWSKEERRLFNAVSRKYFGKKR